jgi:hypothetical protein
MPARGWPVVEAGSRSRMGLVAKAGCLGGGMPARGWPVVRAGPGASRWGGERGEAPRLPGMTGRSGGRGMALLVSGPRSGWGLMRPWFVGAGWSAGGPRCLSRLSLGFLGGLWGLGPGLVLWTRSNGLGWLAFLLFLLLPLAELGCRKGFPRFGSFSSLLGRPFGFGRRGCRMSRSCGIPPPVGCGRRWGPPLILSSGFGGLRSPSLGGVRGLSRPRMTALTPLRLSSRPVTSMSWWRRAG